MAHPSRRPPRSPAPPRRALFCPARPAASRRRRPARARSSCPVYHTGRCCRPGGSEWARRIRNARAGPCRRMRQDRGFDRRSRSRVARMGGQVRAPALFAVALLSAMPAAVRAEGPLYLRIRPNPVPAATAVAGSGQERESGREAGRETVWERADRRARLAIASVCTGCLDTRIVGRPAEAPVSVVRASRSPNAAMAAAEDTVPLTPLWSNPPPAGDP